MMGKTHIAIGALVTTPLILSGTVSVIPAAAGLIGSTFPDIDLKIGLPHRTITHCLLAAGLLTSIALNLDKGFAISFGINYIAHLVADSFTVMGVPFLYPLSKKKYGLKLFKTGGFIESIIKGLLIIVTLLLIARYIMN